MLLGRRPKVAAPNYILNALQNLEPTGRFANFLHRFSSSYALNSSDYTADPVVPISCGKVLAPIFDLKDDLLSLSYTVVLRKTIIRLKTFRLGWLSS